MATCRSCDAEIIWCETENGKRMPVDPDPVSTGNLMLVYAGRRTPLAVVVTDESRVAGALHLSHFATCPHANAHRRP